ncbi:MAG: cupin [Opitutia bacterium]|nr:MAG: cupin [Opitutae bacterium]
MAKFKLLSLNSEMSSPLQNPKIVIKPWGREIWFADQKQYAGKILEVTKGKRLSLQYHERKTETLYLISGKVRLTYRELQSGEKHESTPITESNEFIWEPGSIVHIPVRTIHRFEALEDSVLLEASTPDLTDVVRLQDDYARPSRD